ncbi:MAG: hypothetical protein HYY17_02035 [Planctomycetes bacterium]|nr:hypothetical protein [Planctomycetota bacterium]
MKWKDDHEKDSFGIPDDDPNAAPTPTEIRARVINDARTWRRLRDRVEEGTAECAQVNLKGEWPTCAKDKEKFEVVHFPGDAPDTPYRAEETAYYCAKESVYYYHFSGGKERLDVWLGPFKVTWNRPGK